MYEHRFIAFIDILGFGALVEKSANDNNIHESIVEALNSMQSDKLREDLYAQVNEELVPQEELEEVKEILNLFTQTMNKTSPVTITYFSGSLVISAPEDDVVAAQLIIDLVIKIQIKMWSAHRLLTRGGITHGDLTHVEGGPLFGPAMNRAYYLESKEAKFPRVLIDNSCLVKYRKVRTFGLLESSIKCDGENSYISLATALCHTFKGSSLVSSGEHALKSFRDIYETAPDKLEAIVSSHTDEKIKSKYMWLLSEFLDS